VTLLSWIATATTITMNKEQNAHHSPVHFLCLLAASRLARLVRPLLALESRPLSGTSGGGGMPSNVSLPPPAFRPRSAIGTALAAAYLD